MGLSDFEIKVEKIHFGGKKSTLALFSAILGVKVDFSFWYPNPLIHYFEKILGSKWKKSTFGTFKILSSGGGFLASESSFEDSCLKISYILMFLTCCTSLLEDLVT